MEISQTVLYGLLIAWGIATAALVCVAVYRGTLETHEEDQIFLSGGEERMASEQRLLVARIQKRSRPITALVVISGSLLILTAGLWLWQAFKSF